MGALAQYMSFVCWAWTCQVADTVGGYMPCYLGRAALKHYMETYHCSCGGRFPSHFSCRTCSPCDATGAPQLCLAIVNMAVVGLAIRSTTCQQEVPPRNKIAIQRLCFAYEFEIIRLGSPQQVFCLRFFANAKPRDGTLAKGGYYDIWLFPY